MPQLRPYILNGDDRWMVSFKSDYPSDTCEMCGNSSYTLALGADDTVWLKCDTCCVKEKEEGRRWTKWGKTIADDYFPEILDELRRARDNAAADPTGGKKSRHNQRGMAMEKNTGVDLLKGVLGDASAALKHGAAVGTATTARQFCLDVFHAVLPKDVPGFVLEHPLVKRVEPVVASLVVMCLAVFCKTWLPYADKAYWMAKTALEADGRDILEPVLARTSEMFRERLGEFVIPVEDK